MMEFFKYEASANDFIILDGRFAPPPRVEWIRAACERHTGVGADGVIVLLPSKECDLAMRIFNPDGSEAEMCGNGIRALALFAADIGITDSDEISVETMAGTRSVVRVGAGSPAMFRVCMGLPLYRRKDIPMKGPAEEEAIDVALHLGPEKVRATCVSMGNPHCVVMEWPEGSRFEALGSEIERLPVFPERTNVEFVEIMNPGSIKVRVWERGAGETMACGTGACAALVASSLQGLTRKTATVSLPGGDLLVEWLDDGVYLTGPARKVFQGTTVE